MEHMGVKAAKDDKVQKWQDIWTQLTETDADYKKLYEAYRACRDKGDQYSKYYLKYYEKKKQNINTAKGAEWIFLKAGTLMSHINGEHNTNSIAEKLYDILETNKEEMEEHITPEWKYWILDLCCDIFIACGKENAITYIAILYDLVSQFSEVEGYSSFYDNDTLNHIVTEMKRKWFDSNWLSNDPKKTLEYLKKENKSNKDYVRIFVSLFTDEIIEKSVENNEKNCRRKIVKRSWIGCVLGLLIGIILGNTFLKIGENRDVKKDDVQLGEQLASTETPTPTETLKVTETPTQTETPEVTKIPTKTPEVTSTPSIGNDPVADEEEIDKEEIRLNQEGILEVEERKIRLGAGESYDEVGVIKKGMTIIPLEISLEYEDGYWYQIEHDSIRYDFDTEYYVWLKDGDLSYGD